MRCPKCNNDNPDDAVYCPACYAVLLKPGSASPEPAPAEAKPASKPKPEPRKPNQVQPSPTPWRQISIVAGIASATLLVVSGALWLIGGHGTKDLAVPDSAAGAAQRALNHAFSEARAAGGKVRLERLALLTAAPAAAQNVPSQTLGTYAGWALKKAQAVLADSGRDSQVSVRVTLHPDAAPSFEVAAGEGQPEPVLLQRLRKELDSLDPLHTSAQDVAFEAYFTVKSGVPAALAAAKPPRSKTAKLDVEAVRQACGVELGMFCNEEKAAPASLVSCLREHSHDLLDACRRVLSIPGER
jgi:hypothetical protein